MIRFMPDMITRFAARVGAWLLATAVAYLCAAVLHSQTVLAGLTALQVRITSGERLSMTLGDLIGLHLYAPVIGIGLAIALPVLNLAAPRRWIPSPAVRGAIAGGLAMAVILVTMRQAFGFTPIASAREPIGLALQCVAGALGGMCYGVARGMGHARPGTPRHAGRTDGRTE